MIGRVQAFGLGVTLGNAIVLLIGAMISMMFFSGNISAPFVAGCLWAEGIGVLVIMLGVLDRT